MIQCSDRIVVKMFGDGEYIMINDRTYRIPKKKLFGVDSMCVINGRICINGYELVNGKWKATLFSIFHLFF